ncbi:MAG: biopolymer transporter ExbD [candidate division KSB1 bacterium]|nr:biopolymer transporter ExbD [candidate division KSB1 bacterium]MDZ7365968.1 biopolymer transporter ExbD [candidate division KSB1 bacterium]MDZ7404084.1 biopolymer transporter ExbD [candidate division KSB1 bacterium]
MARTGMIIRYIDIALTMLFGFVAISDIERKTQVKLPREVAAVSSPSQLKTVSILVLDGPRYTVLDGAQEVASDADLLRIEQVLRGLQQSYLRRQEDVIFLIQPDPNSPIQLTVNVLDVCERNHFVKNINYVEPGI